MRTLSSLLGWSLFASAAVALLAWGGVAGYCYWEECRLERLQKEGASYLEAALPAILSGLESNEVEPYCSPSLLADEASVEGLTRALKTWRDLGLFRSIANVEFVKFIPDLRDVLFYTANVRFTNRTVQVTVVIERSPDSWKVRYLNTDLDSLTTTYLGCV